MVIIFNNIIVSAPVVMKLIYQQNQLIRKRIADVNMEKDLIKYKTW